MSLVGFLPVHLQGFYGWLIFVRSWIYFFGSHFGKKKKKKEKNPTNTSTNALKLKTAQYQLAGIYIKEQTEYIQNQIDKIRDSVEDRQSSKQ